MRGGEYKAIRWGRGGRQQLFTEIRTDFFPWVGTPCHLRPVLSFRHKQNARPIPNCFSLPLTL